MKSSDIIVIMVIEAINLLEQVANMKTTMNRPLKETVERDSQINHQNKQIANLTNKLGKRPFETSNKCLVVEDF